MALDLIARGMAGTEIARQKRLRILNTLRASMGRAGLMPLEPAPVLPAITTPGTTATGIATGTLWQVSTSGTPALHAGKYTFLGANWRNIAQTYPGTEFYRPESCHQGNGADPTFGPIYGGRVRFTLDAPSFELYIVTTGAGGGNGVRMKVDGKYARAGTIGTDASAGGWRYYPVTWGDGSAAFRKPRNYELEFYGGCSFLGVRTTNLYRPAPWPQPDGLRLLVHGDSMVGTQVDTGDKDAFLTPSNGYILGDLLGQADTWVSGTGGAGWFTPASHTQSWFNDRVALDVVANAPDVIIELGGVNDEPVLTSGSITQAQHQSAVETWLSSVLAAKPETIVFMTGPMIAGAAPAAGHIKARDAKAAAAAKFPRNVAFIDNFADPWFFGTGKLGAATGDGNRDWAIGTDGVHPTMEGHRYLGGRVARAVSAALPGLIAAQN